MTTTTQYEPELGQIAFGCAWSEYGVPAYAEALIANLLDEIALLDDDEAVPGERFDTCYLHNAPDIPGLELRPYYWGDDEAEAALPNIAFDGVEIRFYKYVGRGMSCNQELAPAQWVEWWERLYDAVGERDGGGDERIDRVVGRGR